MSWAQIAGLPLTPREASAAMAMVTVATEPDVDVVGFCETLRPLDISPRRRLDDVISMVSSLKFGGTDCALPMTDALMKGLEYDTFIVYADSETWSGGIHPYQALRQYRQQTGIDAKLVVVGMAATEFTIADPSDPGMLDVVGFDTAAPGLIGDFVAGRI
jgi:60 kDa SS-A/Ro ribonucleoprotein